MVWSKEPFPIGPTGEHDYGEPVDKNDHGNIDVGIGIYPKHNKVDLQLGVSADSLYMSRAEAIEFVQDLRSMIKTYFPDAKPCESQIVEIFADETEIGGPRVMMKFPTAAAIVSGTPDSWLKMMDEMETAALSIKLT